MLRIIHFDAHESIMTIVILFFDIWRTFHLAAFLMVYLTCIVAGRAHVDSEYK